MARIYTDGAEMGDLSFWDYTYGTTVASATPDPYSGDYYYEVNGSSAITVKYNTSLSECYMRFRVYWDGLGDHVDENPGFRYSSVSLCSLSTDGTGRPCAYIGSTYIGSSSITVRPSSWYLFEIHVKIDDAPNGVFQLKIDGNLAIDFSGDTKGTYSTFDNIYFEGDPIYLDDLAMNDTTGGVDDSWCGDGIITKITPIDNGAHNNWHGSDSDDVDNFELVDEFPNDGDTTYVYHDSSSSGTQDQYDMSEDYDGTDKTITRIYAECRARVTGATTDTLKIGVLPSGSTDQMSSGETLTTGAYTRIVGDEYLVNPADSMAWEEADIDALEGVIEVG